MLRLLACCRFWTNYNENTICILQKNFEAQ